MTDFEGASWDEFIENWTSIAQQLRALRAGPRVRWRRFQRLAIYAKDTHELLGEVVATSPGPVLLYRGGTEDLNCKEDAYMPVKRSADMSVAPVTGDPRQLFMIFGRRKQYPVMGRDIVAALREGCNRLTV